MKAALSSGVDLDRTGTPEPLLRWLRRRLQGRFPVDAFGADPLLADAVDPALESLFSFEVEGEEAIPEIGAATLVTSSRYGPGDPLVVRAVVRDVRRRRARVVGYWDGPVTGPLSRRLGAVRRRGEDLAAALRAGHVAVVPLGATLRPARVGHASVPVLWGAIGFPVIPVVVRGGVGGRLGVPMGHHRVVLGSPLDLDVVPRDPLSAAELAAAARDAVQALWDASEPP